MKITTRQMSKIVDILAEETTTRRSLHREMYSRRQNSLLAEADGAADLVGVAKSLEEDQTTSDLSGELLTKFDKVLFKRLSEVLAQTTGQKKTPATLMDDVEDFDADQLVMDQQELVADISAALVKYAEKVALTVESIALPPEE